MLGSEQLGRQIVAAAVRGQALGPLAVSFAVQAEVFGKCCFECGPACITQVLGQAYQGRRLRARSLGQRAHRADHHLVGVVHHKARRSLQLGAERRELRQHLCTGIHARLLCKTADRIESIVAGRAAIAGMMAGHCQSAGTQPLCFDGQRANANPR